MTKKNTLLVLLAAGASWLALTSYSSGASSGTGGGDLSAAGCNSQGFCHGNNSTATVVQSVTLVDMGGGTPTPAGQYIPGRTYAVTILGSLNPASASLTHFGFQTTARNASDATVGTISVTGTTEIKTYTANNRTGVEQSTKIAKNSGGFFTKTWQWTAPAAGTGTVRFRTAINAVNNNSAATGDQVNTGETQFTEAPLSIDDAVSASLLAIHPNPAKDRISIDARSLRAGDYTITIFSSTGAVMMERAVRHSGADAVDVTLPELATGLYGLRIAGRGQTQSAPLFIR